MLGLVFLLAWIFLLILLHGARSSLLYFFVLCQFVFVGFGLCLFPLLGFDYLNGVFPSFELYKLSEMDFHYANAVVIASTICTVAVGYSFFVVSTVKRTTQSVCWPLQKNSVKNITVYLFIVLIFIISPLFIFDNLSGFQFVFFATDIMDIGGFVNLRRESTSNYLLNLFIYNVLPSGSVLVLFWAMECKRRWAWILFFIVFFLVSFCLLLTFQKRPLIVFWGACALSKFLYDKFNANLRHSKVKILDLIFQQKLIISALLLSLFVLYYFYTGFRFQENYISIFIKLSEVIFTRLIGRLSLPAAMYVDFFPSYAEFYGLANVGLINKVLGSNAFLDTRVVFSHYSVSNLDGSVAASVFIDGYGQGGFLFSIIYGLILGILIFSMEWALSKSSSAAHRAFFLVASFVFLYYLSQASIFRAAFGYGGVFYLLAWISGFRFKKWASP